MTDKDTEVQVSIDRLTVTRADGTTVEAKDVVMTATGPDPYGVGAAISSQLEALLHQTSDDDPEEDAEPDPPNDALQR